MNNKTMGSRGLSVLLKSLLIISIAWFQVGCMAYFDRLNLQEEAPASYSALRYVAWLESASDPALAAERVRLEQTAAPGSGALVHRVQLALLLSASDGREDEAQARRLLLDISGQVPLDNTVLDYRVLGEIWLSLLRAREETRDLGEARNEAVARIMALEQDNRALMQESRALMQENRALMQENQELKEQIEALTTLEQQMIERELSQDQESSRPESAAEAEQPPEQAAGEPVGEEPRTTQQEPETTEQE